MWEKGETLKLPFSSLLTSHFFAVRRANPKKEGYLEGLAKEGIAAVGTRSRALLELHPAPQLQGCKCKRVPWRTPTYHAAILYHVREIQKAVEGVMCRLN